MWEQEFGGRPEVRTQKGKQFNQETEWSQLLRSENNNVGGGTTDNGGRMQVYITSINVCDYILHLNCYVIGGSHSNTAMI